MRRLETEARKEKEIINTLKASGDNIGVKQHRDRLNAINQKYNQISEQTGIPTRHDRMSIVKGGTTNEPKIDSLLAVNKMASRANSKNYWGDAVSRTVTKDEKLEIIGYAKSKGINIVDLSRFDGEPELLKAEIDTLAKLQLDFPIGREKLTVTVSDTLDDAEFARLSGDTTIVFNAKALRNRIVTERNIGLLKGEFASKKMEDIAAHEFGHIISLKKGNKGIEISQKAYYNIYGERLGIDEIVNYISNEISTYSSTYYASTDGRKHKFNVKRYGEVISEILAKNNSNATDFTKEFIKLLKEV